MKAVVLEEYGSTDNLKVHDVPDPLPPQGSQVLVRVYAASINDWEYMQAQGEFVNRMMVGFSRPRKLLVIGCDVSGVVEAVGPDVTGFGPGDEVYGDLSSVGFGAFGEYVRVPESALAAKPGCLTHVEAAAVPQAAMLAVQGLIDVGELRSGQRLLLNGAGGGVGTFALQIAKQEFSDVDVTCVDAGSKLEKLRELGADHVIDYQQTDFTTMGEHYDLVLDPKTNRRPRQYLRTLAEDGIYATVGGMNRYLLSIATMGKLLAALDGKGRQLSVVALKPNKDLGYMNALFESGKVRPVIDSTYPLADITYALQHYGNAKQVGKVVLTM